jgi:competence protein ComEC
MRKNCSFANYLDVLFCGMSVKIKYLYGSLALIIALVIGAVLVYPDQNLHLIFCDVGQGDAILITKGNTQILIDAGPNQKVLSCLSNNIPFWDKTIEMVVLTHPDNDHLGGLPDVIERYNVTQLLSHGLIKDSAIFWTFRDKVLEKNIPVYSPQAGDKIQIAGIVFKVLSPQEKMGDELVWQREIDSQVLGAHTYPENANEVSIVTLLSYGNFDVLLPGDISSQVEEVIETDRDIEILKVAHHGSKYSSSEEFLGRISPDLAIISVGKNPYGHPTDEVLGRLENLGIRILRTDLEGEIEISSNGQEWSLRR